MNHQTLYGFDGLPITPKVKYVHDLLTGRVITSRTVGLYDPTKQWDWISRHVAEWNECEVEDVGCVETDDGEFITVKGKPVAEVRVN